MYDFVAEYISSENPSRSWTYSTKWSSKPNCIENYKTTPYGD